VVVDVVTNRLANLHNELMTLLEQPEKMRFPDGTPISTTAYRPARRAEGGDQIDLWPVALTVGQELPVMPLALRGGATVPVELEITYTEARQRSRL
jgi:hypothetical protein